MNRLYLSAATLGAVIILTISIYAQQDRPIRYQQVRVWEASGSLMETLQNAGITVDHVRGNYEEGFLLVLQEREAQRLVQLGIRHQVEIADMSAQYLRRRAPDAQEIADSRLPMIRDGINGFGFGSMGGFYTYDEVVQQLDSLRGLYPAIIGAKQVIGTSNEGRSIYAVKLSDNPDIDESAAETAVYFDALHHAREPMSMSVLLYYIYWLVENYGSDPEATYLLNEREIFFVPVVNPDGYVYNQQTNPNGGGFWRKNRRNNAGSCTGVDLNRNYSFGYNTGGSSSDPCSDTYHGTAPFSEPEAAAVRDFVAAINPPIGFSTHSVRGAYLNPYGYTSTSPAFDIYSEFAGDFSASNQYIYGRTSEILGYTSSGTTRDYLHSVGTYGWTPEIGGSGFWPSASEIIPLCSEYLYSQKYLTWVAGAFADFQDYRVLNPQGVIAGDTLDLEIAVNNRGLRRQADNVTVAIESDYPEIVFLQAVTAFSAIAPRTIVSNTGTPLRMVLSDNAGFFDEIPLYLSVSQDGIVTSRDTVTVRVGRRQVLFEDGGENGMINWETAGPGGNWDTTSVGFVRGTHAFADSRYGNAANNANQSMTLKLPLSLWNTGKPVLSYWAKWAMESDVDYARAQISFNDGRVWVTLGSDHTQLIGGQQGYSDINNWVYQSFDLTAYRNNDITIRFWYISDGGLNGDGIYIDDVRVTDYRQQLVSVPEPGDNIVRSTRLKQNFPNPFNPATAIPFELASSAEIRLTIYNLLGEQVRSLASGVFSAGSHEIRWNGRDDAGESVAAGTYIYRLESGGQKLSQKMYLIK